ncbi:MAG: hypothetical protein HZC54_07905 [Verrucomicrobia bacterium]|nr:hypothetical protein [Verrucomicrobiota bacterium]
MPHRRLPNTAATVLRALKAARDTWKNSRPADRAITNDQWTKLDDENPDCLLSRFIKESNDVSLALAAQAPITAALTQTNERLAMFVSHFHQVLNFGILRGLFDPGARSYYGRDIAATTIPDLSTQDAVIEAAEKVVSGEAARAAAESAGVPRWDGSPDGGTIPHVPMSHPTAAEVAALLAHLADLQNKSQSAQTKTDLEREDVTRLYPEAHALAVDICDTVEFFHRKDPDASSRRAKCARWGVVYIYDDGETQSPTGDPSSPGPIATP